MLATVIGDGGCEASRRVLDDNPARLCGSATV
jgi:hypothetical protein